MGKAVAEFVIGAAVILTPQYQVPLLLGSAALKIVSSAAHQSHQAAAEHDEHGDGPIDMEHLTIKWDHLSVALPAKKTKQITPIFKDLQGSARPGRQVSSWCWASLAAAPIFVFGHF